MVAKKGTLVDATVIEGSISSRSSHSASKLSSSTSQFALETSSAEYFTLISFPELSPSSASLLSGGRSPLDPNLETALGKFLHEMEPNIGVNVHVPIMLIQTFITVVLVLSSDNADHF